MGGSSSRIEKKPFQCNNKYSIKPEPLKFNNLEHKRCIFFPNDYYKEKRHLPSATLTIQFESTINNLENDIENEINKVYNNINRITSAKILNPIYIAFARKLEYTGSIFDDPSLINIEVEKPRQRLAIKDFISSFLRENPSYVEKYNALPSNRYGFKNNKINVIIYFPFLTKNYKYITNFKDIIATSSFFTKILLDSSYSGLPDVNTFDENKLRKELEESGKSTNTINSIMNDLKQGDNRNFRLKDDLMYLCNEGGCISDIGENFNILLPSLGKTDSDNTNVAVNQSPFLPNKCLAQTIRYKCGILAPEGNRPFEDIMKSETIIKYLTEKFGKYILNKYCKLDPNADKRYCEENSDKYANVQETPIDIINQAYSFELRNQYASDYKTEKKNHYSIDYSTNIIKELMFLRNTYPGIPEIIFPLYKYIGNNNNIINPPWGPYFITKYNMINYGEIILINDYKFSLNNKYFIKMNEKGHIYVSYVETEEIYYFLNIIDIKYPLSMSFTNNIDGIVLDTISNNQTPRKILDIELVIKDDKHREPYNFYINDEGKIRVFANGFIDATNKAFIEYIDNKITEYKQYGKNNNNNIDYYKIYGNNNKIDIKKAFIEGALYLDQPENASKRNIQK